MRSTAITYLLLFTALIIAGCATMHEEKRVKSLAESMKNYRTAIRWGLYDVADNIRGAGSSEDRSLELKEFRKIKVTGYKSLFMKMSDDKKEAEQTVEITFYHTDRMIEKKIIDKQVWKYDNEKETWYLQSGLPQFK